MAAEKLGERHDVRVSRETLRGWMRQAGIWLPRAERKRIQQPRHRREHFGELIQIDGSDHRWFEDRAAPCTLQDRLMKELRLAGISTIEAANAFLPAFVQTYNARFAKPPARDRDLHRPMAGINDLDDILCWREQRSVSRQLVVNYNRMKFMLRPDKTP